MIYIPLYLRLYLKYKENSKLTIQDIKVIIHDGYDDFFIIR